MEMKGQTMFELESWYHVTAINAIFASMDKYTSGIAHKKRARVTVVYKCNTRVRTDKCTEKRVNLNMGGDV